jgi:hypothetical protein
VRSGRPHSGWRLDLRLVPLFSQLPSAGLAVPTRILVGICFLGGKN